MTYEQWGRLEHAAPLFASHIGSAKAQKANTTFTELGLTGYIMNWLVCLFQHEGTLRFLQISLVVAGLTVAISFFIPRGMESYQKWKKKQHRIDLTSAIGNISTGIFILLYLLGALLVELARR